MASYAEAAQQAANSARQWSAAAEESRRRTEAAEARASELQQALNKAKATASVAEASAKGDVSDRTERLAAALAASQQREAAAEQRAAAERQKAKELEVAAQLVTGMKWLGGVELSQGRRSAQEEPGTAARMREVAKRMADADLEMMNLRARNQVCPILPNHFLPSHDRLCVYFPPSSFASKEALSLSALSCFPNDAPQSARVQRQYVNPCSISHFVPQAMAMELATERKRAADAEAMAASVTSAARSAVGVVSQGSGGDLLVNISNKRDDGDAGRAADVESALLSGGGDSTFVPLAGMLRRTPGQCCHSAGPLAVAKALDRVTVAFHRRPAARLLLLVYIMAIHGALL